MKKFYILKVLTKDDLEHLSRNFKLSNHASVRLKERFDTTDLSEIKTAVKESYFAYVACDNIINVGLRDGTVFKFAQCQPRALMITYLERSMSRTSIKQKYKYACRGGNR